MHHPSIYMCGQFISVMERHVRQAILEVQTVDKLPFNQIYIHVNLQTSEKL